MNPDNLNQVEHEKISNSLDVEKLDVNLFRSKSLWLPLRARGVFGGQVISQALVSATACVPSPFALHSMHCYFLTSASSATPIIYNVDRVRDGNSYVTRAVRAVQNGRTAFIMLCSFHKPEPWQPSLQWPMPNVPSPEQCVDEEVAFQRSIEKHRGTPLQTIYEEILGERQRSPIAIRLARGNHTDEKGVVQYAYWMKARNIPKYEAPFQKCILAYISDLRFISTPVQIVGLKRGGKGPDGLGMNSTLDHAIWFYDHEFDTGDWLLYEMDCPRVGSGRAVMHGRMFTRDGTLIAVLSQEGVLRANIRGPDEPSGKKATPKL